MARTSAALYDWHTFLDATRLRSVPCLWSRFPVELSADLIVCPHLYNRSPSAAHRPADDDVYTYAGSSNVMVFCSRGDAHRAFLIDEVIPRVQEHVPLVCLVDGDAARFAVAPIFPGGWRDLGELPPLLARVYGEPVMPPHVIEALERSRAGAPGPSVLYDVPPSPARLALLERTPLRLWEALFWRGHTYRYEVVANEVPLIGELFSPLAANRTLVQLVSDAERLVGAPATERAGWHVVGPIRVRQLASQVEVRVRLSPADLRAAFLPQARLDGDDDLPSILGTMMAAGSKGKTELWNGWTWSTILSSSIERSRCVASHLQRQISAWTGAEATIVDADSFNLPDEFRDVWFIEVDERFLTVYVPFGRERSLAWAVHAGMLGDW